MHFLNSIGEACQSWLFKFPGEVQLLIVALLLSFIFAIVVTSILLLIYGALKLIYLIIKELFLSIKGLIWKE